MVLMAEQEGLLELVVELKLELKREKPIPRS
jgi:hypothetical protein